ncbi:MAG: DUF484 family protein [Thiohalomonadaceae bacterium]
MSEVQEQAVLSEQQVAEYLRQHPDFFSRHEALLGKLRITHPHSGMAVSLIERQVELIREQKQDLRQQLQQLTQAARNNEALLQRFQVLILHLIGSDSMEQALGYVRDAMQQDFHADAVEILLFDRPERSESIASDDPRLRPFSRVLQGRQPVCGHLSAEQCKLLFGRTANEIASAVVVPLCEDARHPCIGLLGIGSMDPKRYHPEMGTVFLGHLGSVMNRIFLAHLDR